MRFSRVLFRSRTCLASRFDCAATRSTSPRVLPTRLAYDSRGRQGFAKISEAWAFERLYQESLRNRAVRIHAAIAPEGPVAANVLDPLQVHLRDQHLFFVVRGLRD